MNKENPCNNKESLYGLNLNNIHFHGNVKDFMYSYEYLKPKISSIPGFFNYIDPKFGVNIPLCDIKYVSKGSFGTVLSYAENSILPSNFVEVKDPAQKNLTYYQNKDTGTKSWIRPKGEKNKPEIKIAVKTFKYPNDPEIVIINRLNKIGLNCNTVNSKILSRTLSNGTTLTIAVMDIMNGSLSDLKKNVSVNTAIDITKTIAEELDCLNDNNLAYTDLKTGNILYKCDKDKILKIVLGDLGSICEQGKTNSVTYPPPEFIFPSKKRVVCNESTMVWGLGIIILELLGANVYDLFYHGTIGNYNVNTFKQALLQKITNLSDKLTLSRVEFDISGIDKIKGNKTQLDVILLYMLDIDPSKRITLNLLIDILKTLVSSHNVVVNKLRPLGVISKKEKKKSEPINKSKLVKAVGSV